MNKIEKKNYVILISIIAIMGLFLIGNVSAWEWDNIKSYDPETETVTITNALGFGQKLAEIQLLENTDYCLTNCYALIKLDLKTSYDNPFSNLRFKKYLKKKLEDTNIKEYKLLLKTTEGYQVDVADYGTCQRNVKDNKTALIVKESYSCVVGYHKETKYREVWKEYKGESLDAGVYYFRIEGKKGIYEDLEWIPTFLGRDINEWASWLSGWVYRKPITITNPHPTALKEYPVNITIDTSGDSFQDDGDDIRIVNNESNEIDWANTTECNSATTEIWFRYNGSASSSTTYYVYYGNPSASDVRVTESDIRGMFQDSNTKMLLHLDEGTGNFAKDETGNNNATHTDGGSLRWQPNGKFGKALNNTGVTTYTAQINHSSELNPSTGSYTFEFWVRYNATTPQYIFRKAGTGYYYIAAWTTPPVGSFRFAEGGGGSTLYSSNSWNATGWHHIAVVRNYGGTNYIYVDGMLNGSIADSSLDNSPLDNLTLFGNVGVGEYFSGDLDEVRFSNKARTLIEIRHSALYYTPTTSVGSEESSGGSVTATLSLPINNYETHKTSIVFEANFSASNAELSNSTLYIWNPGGNLFISNFTTISGTTNTTSQNISGLSSGTNYKWTFRVRGINTTLGKSYNYTADNRTFSITANIKGESYETDVYETANETFQINITLVSDIEMYGGKLIYNGTVYTVKNIKKTDTDTYSLTKTIDIPLVTKNTTKNFYWQFIYEGGATWENTTAKTQNVTFINMSKCGYSFNSNIGMNFTLRDELHNLEILDEKNNQTFKATFYYWLGLGSVIKNISIQNHEVNESSFAFCFDYDSTYSLSADIEYTVEDYVTRSYYIRNATIKPSNPTNISLYNLEEAESTSFLIKYEDENYLAIAEAIIEIWKKYVGEGDFKVVEMSMTDEDGQTVGHLIAESAVYMFIVKKDNVVLYISPEYRALCLETPCQINLRARRTISELPDFSVIDNLAYSLTFDESIKTVSLVYSVIDGTPQILRLEVIKYDWIGNTTECNTSQESAGGTINCDLSTAQGNTTYFARSYFNNKFIASKFVSIGREYYKYFGTTGIILTLLIFLCFVLMGISTPEGAIVFGLIGLLLASWLSIISLPYSILIYLIIAGVLILIKVGRGREY